MKKIKEKSKADFIYSLKNVTQKEAVIHLSFFLKFISENIKSSSGNIRMAVINMSKWIISSLPQPLNEKEEKMICRFIDRMIDMMDDYYKEEFSQHESITELPPSVYKSLQILISRVFLSQDYYRKIYEKHLKNISPSIDCTWRRDPCSNKECPVCMNGKSIQDVPVLEENVIYKRVRDWGEKVFLIAEEAEEDGDFWMFTRAACDLFWYSNVLLVKCSVLTTTEPLSFENNYARYVTRECLKIIKKSIKEIICHDPVSKNELRKLFSEATRIEKKILQL